MKLCVFHSFFLRKRVKFYSLSLFSRNESEIEMTGNRDREVKQKLLEIEKWNFKNISRESRLLQVTDFRFPSRTKFFHISQISNHSKKSLQEASLKAQVKIGSAWKRDSKKVFRSAGCSNNKQLNKSIWKCLRPAASPGQKTQAFLAWIITKPSKFDDNDDSFEVIWGTKECQRLWVGLLAIDNN